jgi:hypothetical protein
MKRTNIKFFLLGLGFIALTASVQAGDPVAEMMRSGADDITKIAGVELKPLGNSLAAGLGGGWYNTAKPHKILGIDLTVSFNLATIPATDKMFDFAAQKFSALSLSTGTNASMPTLIAYDDQTGPDMVLKTKAQTVSMALPSQITGLPSVDFDAFVTSVTPSLQSKGASIDKTNKTINYNAPAETLGKPIQLKGFVPKAIPFVAIPTPTAQLGIGLVFNTDLIIRYMPTVPAGGLKIGLYGFGIKHDIKQWIPVVKNIPFFDLSALVGYTKLTSTYDLDVNPTMYGDASTLIDKSSPATWKGQQMAISASALTTQIIVSKGLLLNIFTPYVGLGLTSTSFEIDIKGKYPLLKSALNVKKADGSSIDPFIVSYNSTNPASSTIAANPDFQKFYVEDKNPLTDYMTPKKISSNKTMPNVTVGLRLKLLILTIHAQYTLQTYSMYSAGIGFAFR